MIIERFPKMITVIIIFLLFGFVPKNASAESIMGVVQGSIVGSESHKSLSNAAIILCSVVAEHTCVLKSDLTTRSGEDGGFTLSEVPAGSYVVFYDPSGKACGEWSKLDGQKMILKPEGFQSSRSAAGSEVFSTFGGGGKILIKKGTTLKFQDGKLITVDGSVVSDKFGLTLDFHKGQPITIDIQTGKATELEIKAWGL
ncbi:MAG: hypothetical protein R6T90_09555 [Dissulfuribacterales bacterium]